MFVAQAQRATLVQLSLSFAIAACRKSICFAAGRGGRWHEGARGRGMLLCWV